VIFPTVYFSWAWLSCGARDDSTHLREVSKDQVSEFGFP
jgi:hypothetical protein